VIRNTYTVDEQGLQELSAILDDAVDRLDAAGEAARRRLDKDEGIDATAVVLLFDTPDPERARTTRAKRRTRSGGTAAAAG
jgi:hypothetical protein